MPSSRIPSIHKRRLALSLIPVWFFLPVLQVGAANVYQEIQIDGWTLMFDRGLQTADAISKAAFMRVLTDQLNKLKKLPVHAQIDLHSVSIYVSSATYRAFGAQHHPSAQWLREHGYPVEFAGNIEICNWKEFTTLVRSQPYALLHEMAHAYHFMHPDLDALVMRAYDNAKLAGLYRQVTRDHKPGLQEAYAISNHHEYFAELSEAYFGENDFYPYQNAELKEYDVRGYAMLESVWKL
ncbi:hypothetical protein [Undibacterium sp. TS12]|uniref:hypothetical protein n=1 Tax=Undibacterium sp. TS12 TaxID=2908202 RepID=UPI001F4CFEF7|nr:hypothetical protein [Undibacterium sp. TS12]MCH8619764.1 hypothetical protein [Undibacterium sp. TS12]